MAAAEDMPVVLALAGALLKEGSGEALDPVGAVAMGEALVGAHSIRHGEAGMDLHIDPYSPGACLPSTEEPSSREAWNGRQIRLKKAFWHEAVFINKDLTEVWSIT